MATQQSPRIRYTLHKSGILTPVWTVTVVEGGLLSQRTTRTRFRSETAALAFVASLGAET